MSAPRGREQLAGMALMFVAFNAHSDSDLDALKRWIVATLHVLPERSLPPGWGKALQRAMRPIEVAPMSREGFARACFGLARRLNILPDAVSTYDRCQCAFSQWRGSSAMNQTRCAVVSGEGRGALRISSSCEQAPRDSRDGFSPSVWGPIFWELIHFAAARYDAGKVRWYRRWIEATGDVLPCRSCRDNYEAHLVQAGWRVEHYRRLLLRRSDRFQRFCYHLHDATSRTLGSPHAAATAPSTEARYARLDAHLDVEISGAGDP